MWFFVESLWAGKPTIVTIPYRTSEEAIQAAQREAATGVFRILEFDTRDKREIFRRWRMGQYSVITSNAY